MGRSEITLDTSPDVETRPDKNRDWRRIAPGLVISAISLIAVVYFADLGRMLQALRMANVSYLFLGIGVSVLWLLVRAIIWRALLLNRAPYRTVFLTMNEGYLFNNLLPLRLGEVARAFLLSRKTSLAFWEVISSILIERSMDVALAVGVLLVSLPFVVGGNWAYQAAISAGLLIVAIFAVLYLLARYRERALVWFYRLGERWPFLLKVAGRAVPTFLTGLSVLTNGRVFLTATGWMLVNWGIGVAQYYLIMRAFFPDPRLLWATFGLGVSALGVAAPSSPGAIGVMELAVVGSLSVFGLDPSTALAYAFSMHMIQYLTTGVFGIYALTMDGESLVGLYARFRKMKEVTPEEHAG